MAIEKMNELRIHTIADLQLHVCHCGKLFLALSLALSLALALALALDLALDLALALAQALAQALGLTQYMEIGG